MPEQDGRVYGKQRRRQSLRRVEAATAGLEQYMTPAKVLQHVHRLVDSYKQARLHLKRRANRRDKRKRRFLRHHGLDDYSRGSN
ncbi:TPA: hypothetical protein DEP96_00460 [Candidatus Uhrbacteria bacterium]|nr:hypothetical protein [Candidatus Uhrbacteria bacterium]